MEMLFGVVGRLGKVSHVSDVGTDPVTARGIFLSRGENGLVQ